MKNNLTYLFLSIQTLYHRFIKNSPMLHKTNKTKKNKYNITKIIQYFLSIQVLKEHDFEVFEEFLLDQINFYFP